MARPQRRKTARKRTITEGEINWLLRGGLGMDYYDTCAGFNYHKAQRIWQETKHLILAAWIEILPGCRPYFWWKSDVPKDEPVRRCLTAENLISSLSEPLDSCTGFGLSTIRDPRGQQEYEAEFDYLERLGLLTDAEKDSNPDTMRANSAQNWAGRGRDTQVQRVMQKLGF